MSTLNFVVGVLIDFFLCSFQKREFSMFLRCAVNQDKHLSHEENSQKQLWGIISKSIKGVTSCEYLLLVR